MQNHYLALNIGTPTLCLIVFSWLGRLASAIETMAVSTFAAGATAGRAITSRAIKTIGGELQQQVSLCDSEVIRQFIKYGTSSMLTISLAPSDQCSKYTTNYK